jgi:predicted O-methyltransferase YrrM
VRGDLFRRLSRLYHVGREIERQRRRARLATVAGVDGMLSEVECALLHDLARAARGGCIVEIGTYHGKGTIALALGARAGARVPVYSIDPFRPYSGPLGRHRFGPADKTELLRNLLRADVAEQVWLIHTPAEQAAAGWREAVALLVVDGDHAYEGVRTDFARWAPFVVPGGVIAFDDSLDACFGVARLIGEVLAAGGYERLVVKGKITAIRNAGAPSVRPPHCT